MWKSMLCFSYTVKKQSAGMDKIPLQHLSGLYQSLPCRGYPVCRQVTDCIPVYLWKIFQISPEPIICSHHICGGKLPQFIDFLDCCRYNLIKSNMEWSKGCRNNHMSGIFIHFMRICRASFETIGSKLRRLSNKMYKYSRFWLMRQPLDEIRITEGENRLWPTR